ncbi:MAG TPA: tryptophan--tRNA ligase, partial [Dielma fastidiosa]|nr:tryptophan--tRNA ligase [Dielma fastidiosa]
FLTELQGRYNEIINSGICEQVLEEGRLKAGKLAHKKLMKVKKRVGFQIFNH